MEIIVFLSIVIAVGAVLTSIVLVRRVKKQIAEMTDVLVDVKNGNGNRRILSATNELTAPLAYEINEIVVAYESRLSTVRQTEETNRQLMTSLSHDVRTPLTTLIGYLDAAHKGLVTGKDRDDYIETARRKAHDLKEYIDVLFDWFKLNSNEFALEIQSVEAAELTRKMRSVDIGAVAAESLPDVSGMTFDNALSRKERISQFLQTVKNPYCFCIGGVGVKIEFAESGPSLQDKLTDFLLRQRSGL